MLSTLSLNTRGRVSLGSLFWILLLAGFVYSVIMFAGPYVDDVEVKDALSKAVNQSNQSDEFLKAFILSQVNDEDTGSHFQTDPVTGEEIEVPGMGFTNDDIVITRNTVARHISIRVDYERTVILKPTTSRVTMRFSPQKDGPIK